MTRRRSNSLLLSGCWLATAALCLAQADTPEPPSAERWNLYWQATSIGQHHSDFPALYTGPNSLLTHPESRVSLTTTLFLGFRLARGTVLYFDPEIAGGKGFSG